MNERLEVYDSKMQKTLNNLDGELATIRAGRANPHVLDKLTVSYYGVPTPIQQAANISVPEARPCGGGIKSGSSVWSCHFICFVRKHSEQYIRPAGPYTHRKSGSGRNRWRLQHRRAQWLWWNPW